MKLKIFMMALVLGAGVMNQNVLASNDTREIVVTTPSNTELKQAVASFYGIQPNGVTVGTLIKYEGQDAWPFSVPALGKHGLVIQTTNGLIVIDEADGF
jgi:hypothetical protein